MDSTDPTKLPGQTPIDSILEAYRKRRDREASRHEERGLIQIGNPANKETSSPETLASYLKAYSQPFETTGLPAPAQAASSSIGTRLGETGAAEPLKAIGQALTALDSDAAEAALHQWLKLVKPWLKCTVNDAYDLTGFEPTGQMTDDLAAEMAQIAEALNRPSEPEHVATEVTRCLTATRAREHADIDLRALIGLLTDELTQFPADIVATTCRKWARQEKWWPTLAELRDQCQRATKWRKSLAKCST